MKRGVGVTVTAVVTTAAAAVAVAVLVRHWRRRKRYEQARRILRRFARRCATPAAKLWHVADEMASEIEATLSSSDPSTNLLLLVAYLAPLPTGEEKGTYYGIDLRGTNFLIVKARLEGKDEPLSEVSRHEVAIPSDIAKVECTRELCDFMAHELAKFVSFHSETDSDARSRERKLGFTLSFAMDEAPESSGMAIKWNRSLVDDTVGKELAAEINQALEKHGVDMRVFTVVNDTVGYLAGGRYYSDESVTAVNLSMGTDIAYVELSKQTANSPKESSKSAENGHQCAVGKFQFLESSINGVFEKLISGMFLGEIVRRVLLKMAQEAALFGDCLPPKLTTPYLLMSPDVAAMHQDVSEDYQVVGEKLKEIFDITNSSPMAREIVSEVCDIVAERGARLVGAGIVGVVKKTGRMANRKSVITIEGGLYEHYRIFRNYLHSCVWEMLGSELSENVIIEYSHGGSGAGSVFLAASQTHF
ncbi:putative hexokinase-like 2 protein [Sesamum angolense]|uniref:Phosphotransferase n=2 Tax=Sesamum TaxID=4181 RepID=A0AAE1WHL5_9LAMI|nr:putative hexokinase-like 2 protein [Sesamum angolense]